jgi:epoxyqueuosine reductase QueG
MQNDSFNSRFKKSPIKRSKLEGIKRNIVAIQNNSKISSR